MPTFTMPLPDSILSGHANFSSKWKIISLTKKLRGQAKLIGIAGMNRRKPFAKARVSYAFYVKDNRKRDAENMRHCCKAIVDGLVEGGVMAGDHWQVLESGPATVEIDKNNPRVEITIEEVK